MIGLHTNGVHIVGGNDVMWKKLKDMKVVKADKITSTTLVFAVNSFEILNKKYYRNSFQGGETPWFLCRTADDTSEFLDVGDMLTFSNMDDIINFIATIYYSVKGSLHLDYDVLEYKKFLQQKENTVIKSYLEEDFKNLPRDNFNWCFAFVDGGFMASDKLFQLLTKDVGVPIDKLRLVGNFSSAFSLVVSFVLEDVE